MTVNKIFFLPILNLENTSECLKNAPEFSEQSFFPQWKITEGKAGLVFK